MPYLRPPLKPAATSGAVGAAGVMIVGTAKLAWWSFCAFGLFVLLGGYAYSRSDSFRLECTAHKLFQTTMTFPKGLICDLDFTVDPRASSRGD